MAIQPVQPVGNPQIPPPSWSNFTQWFGAMTLLTFIALELVPDDNQIMPAILWLTVVAMGLYYFDAIDQSLAEIIGYHLA